MGIGIIVLFSVISIFAPYLATNSPWKQNIFDAHEPPSKEYFFGTDQYGRDIFSRIIYGARVSMLTAFSAAGIAGAIGMTLGIFAGYFGGWIDTLVQGLVDVTWSIPSIVLGLSFALLVVPGQTAIVLTVIVGWWSQYSRVIRSEAISVKNEEYVLAARAIGCSNMRIMWKEIFPNVVGPVIVLVSLTIGKAIIVEATLSFLGVGISPPTPSWGVMLSSARAYINDYPWTAIFPGLAISITVLGFNFIGDGLRDILDPYLRQGR